MAEHNFHNSHADWDLNDIRGLLGNGEMGFEQESRSRRIVHLRVEDISRQSHVNLILVFTLSSPFPFPITLM
jgi:hypothetical protein